MRLKTKLSDHTMFHFQYFLLCQQMTTICAVFIKNHVPTKQFCLHNQWADNVTDECWQSPGSVIVDHKCTVYLYDFTRITCALKASGAHLCQGLSATNCRVMSKWCKIDELTSESRRKGSGEGRGRAGVHGRWQLSDHRLNIELHGHSSIWLYTVTAQGRNENW